MDKSLLEGLSEEQRKAFKECKTMEDVLELVDEEGYEMSDAQMAAVSGGGCGKKNQCCDQDAINAQNNGG